MTEYTTIDSGFKFWEIAHCDCALTQHIGASPNQPVPQAQTRVLILYNFYKSNAIINVFQ